MARTAIATRDTPTRPPKDRSRRTTRCNPWPHRAGLHEIWWVSRCKPRALHQTAARLSSMHRAECPCADGECLCAGLTRYPPVFHEGQPGEARRLHRVVRRDRLLGALSACRVAIAVRAIRAMPLPVIHCGSKCGGPDPDSLVKWVYPGEVLCRDPTVSKASDHLLHSTVTVQHCLRHSNRYPSRIKSGQAFARKTLQILCSSSSRARDGASRREYRRERAGCPLRRVGIEHT